MIMRLCSMKRGKSYVDRLYAHKLLGFSLFKTSFEFLMDQNRFLPDLSKTLSQYLHMLPDGSKTRIRQFRKFSNGTRA